MSLAHILYLSVVGSWTFQGQPQILNCFKGLGSHSTILEHEADTTGVNGASVICHSVSCWQFRLQHLGQLCYIASVAFAIEN